jgi:hypothetical protein
MILVVLAAVCLCDPSVIDSAFVAFATAFQIDFLVTVFEEFDRRFGSVAESPLNIPLFEKRIWSRDRNSVGM